MTQLAPPEGIGPLRRHRLDFARLYFVCEPNPEGTELEPLLLAALNGGAGLIQLRDKQGERELSRRSAPTFRRLADTYSALFIVNDDPGLGVELGADGVHLGQEDMGVAEAREIVGVDAIVGLSTHSPEQIDAAQKAGVDYISVGPVWETPTKPGRPATGLELVRHAAANSAVPFFAIGGIDPGNAPQVAGAGAQRMVVVRAIRDAADPRLAAAALHDLLEP